ncbi:MAG: PfkB family carbohydrate kinase [Candidatus Acidiferrales bacterium]|jgi:sulfofructose kinase
MIRRRSIRPIDVLGVGINATDTIIRLPRFPASDSKVELVSAEVKPGGQVASAIVACQRWGLRTRYVGKIGEDAAGKFQVREMAREGVETHWINAPNSPSQTSFILVDARTGERTVLWRRDPRIAIAASDLRRGWLRGCRALLVDGHDTAASTQAAQWARSERIPVIADLDNLYRGVKALLKYVDFPITSKDFPARLTGEQNLLKSLPKIHAEFKCRLTTATLGSLGAIVWNGETFFLARGFKVRAIDTTGAGDIFHAAFIYGFLQAWPLEAILEFSNAAAALNCTAFGARGRIANLAEIDNLRRTAARSRPAFSRKQLLEASQAAIRKFPALRSASVEKNE